MTVLKTHVNSKIITLYSPYLILQNEALFDLRNKETNLC